MTQSILYQKSKKTRYVGPQGMKGFFIIWLGQIFSLIGSGMTCFAQSVWVYTDLGGSITNLTALAVFAQLPGLVVSPIAGALVDRWDRRWVMIISDAVAAIATMTLRTLIVTESFQLWHIYAIVIVISIANHFQWPAYFATISLMVPRDNLGSANGLVQMGRSLGQIAAPFMAGVAVTLFRIQGVILFDMLSYLFALCTLLIVRIPKPPVAQTNLAVKRSLKREILYGWKYLLDRPGLTGLLALFSASNFLLGVTGLLLMPMALSVTTATVYGSLLSVGGISMLVGSLVMGVWGGPKRRVYGVLGFMLLQGLGIMLVGLRPSVPLFFGASLLFYFSTPIVNACGGAIWQSKVAPEVQGRVLAASGMVSTGSLELAYLIAGPLADHIFEPLMAVGGPLAGSIGRIIGVGTGRGIGLMFLLFGGLCLVVAVVGYLYPRLRRLDSELPDVAFEAMPVGLEKVAQTVPVTPYV